MPFRCLKLRTMHEGTESLPTHEVGKGAVTKTGRVLRRLKFDELPQLWNVIKGEMSLVGPRPCLPTQKVLIERRRALGIYKHRPGITGLAQVKGIGMSDPPKCAEMDAEYLRAQTLALDVKIIVSTLYPQRNTPRGTRRISPVAAHPRRLGASEAKIEVVMKVVPVIISGGAGSRLWPASRQSHPKPFLKVADGHSLIQHTVLRAASIAGRRGACYRDVQGAPLPYERRLRRAGFRCSAAHLSARARGSGYGCRRCCGDRPCQGNTGSGRYFVHLSGRSHDWRSAGISECHGPGHRTCEAGTNCCPGHKSRLDRTRHSATSRLMVKKLSVSLKNRIIETAKAYVASKRFFWNAGIFCFSAQIMLDEMASHCPAIIEAVHRKLREWPASVMATVLAKWNFRQSILPWLRVFHLTVR